MSLNSPISCLMGTGLSISQTPKLAALYYTGISKCKQKSFIYLRRYTSHSANKMQVHPISKLQILKCVMKNDARTICSSKFLLGRSSPPLHSQENRHTDQCDQEQKDISPNIGEGSWDEIYNGVLTTQLKLLKMFSIGTSIIGLSVQPILYQKLGTADLTFVVAIASMFGFFTFLTPAVIHWVAKKYVTKLEYDPERDIYVATTLSFFVKERKLHFKVDDVIQPDIPGMFTSFLVKKRPLFVDPAMFDDVGHYIRLMGYDKPLDLTAMDKHKKPN